MHWSLFLLEFDYNLVHVLGTQMIQSDTLSWRSDHDHGDTDNEDILMLPDLIFVQTINTSLLEHIQTSKKLDIVAHQACNALNTNGPWPMYSSSKDWWQEDRLLFYCNAVYIPPEESLWCEAVQLHHDLPSIGHPGIQKTLLLLKCNFWWPGIYSFITKYVQGCSDC